MRYAVVLLFVASGGAAFAGETLTCESPQLAGLVGKEIAAIKSEGDTSDPVSISACLRDTSSEDCWLRCVPGRFPDARLAIDARYGHFGFFMTVTPEGRVVARSREEWKSADVWTLDSFSVVDFDHDGVDELVEEYEPSGRGITIHAWRALGVKGAQVIGLLDVNTLFDNGDAIEDRSRLFRQRAGVKGLLLKDGSTELRVTRLELQRGARSSWGHLAMPAGTTRYRLHAGRFERVPAR